MTTTTEQIDAETLKERLIDARTREQDHLAKAKAALREVADLLNMVGTTDGITMDEASKAIGLGSRDAGYAIVRRVLG